MALVAVLVAGLLTAAATSAAAADGRRSYTGTIGAAKYMPPAFANFAPPPFLRPSR